MPIIFFDLMGVVFTDKEVIKKYFYPYTRSKTYEEVKTLYHEFSLGKITEEKFLKELNMQIGWRDKFFACFHLNPEFTRCASHLMEKNALFGLTNFPEEWAEELSERFELFHYLNGIISSASIGSRKPSKEIYEHACSQGVGECIFVDDEIENLDVAKKYGRTIYYSKELNKAKHEQVHDLSALKELLGEKKE
ncbi:HAD-IA family hydrolase [Candidatus Micrarchaeota archaeon]|nr:HAD-IA family hydrolase [Candidatus Micrarchaeota archaeon]